MKICSEAISSVNCKWEKVLISTPYFELFFRIFSHVDAVCPSKLLEEFHRLVKGYVERKAFLAPQNQEKAKIFK